MTAGSGHPWQVYDDRNFPPLCSTPVFSPTEHSPLGYVKTLGGETSGREHRSGNFRGGKALEPGIQYYTLHPGAAMAGTLCKSQILQR